MIFAGRLKKLNQGALPRRRQDMFNTHRFLNLRTDQADRWIRSPIFQMDFVAEFLIVRVARWQDVRIGMFGSRHEGAP